MATYRLTSLNKARVGEPARGVFQLKQRFCSLRRQKLIESIARITWNVIRKQPKTQTAQKTKQNKKHFQTSQTFLRLCFKNLCFVWTLCTVLWKVSDIAFRA